MISIFPRSLSRTSPIFTRSCLLACTNGEVFAVGSNVQLGSGEKGVVLECGKAGWFKVGVLDSLSREVKVSKVRRSALSALEKSQSGSVELQSFVKTSAVISTAIPVFHPPKLHASTSKWVLFSDLHVKSASIDTCEQVLERVHAEAEARKAGVIFLGDFWHVRGALGVDLLNRVLRSLQKWHCPVIMIPGNHDQVNLGGSIHSLEPLQYAFEKSQALIFSDPIVCLGALWVPYRRDIETMNHVLAEGISRSDIKAVFCHADVRGAFMNDGIKSREGIDVDKFPAGKPIYSGHFHKPHSLTRADIKFTYLGSPYQTSLSEGGQEKFLYCLSVDDQLQWREDERWTIDLGKKYFIAQSFSDPVVATARAGDRLVVQVARNAVYTQEMESLKSKGVEIELRFGARVPLISAKASLLSPNDEQIRENTSELKFFTGNEDPVQLFDEFMNQTSVFNSIQNVTSKSNIYDLVVNEGKETLRRLSSAGNISSGSSVLRELRLRTVRLKNFGPYGGGEVVYPLSNRGLVLVRGQSPSDSTGADSNGVGKTTLAMSVMWALTGSMDTRLIADGKAVDVTYDSTGLCDGGKSRTADVTLEGEINGRLFTLKRRRSAKKSELIFSVDGVVHTQQSVKDTQAVVDDILGSGEGILQRCCFFGQHSHTLQSLLGLSDVKLKSEMASLLDIRHWNDALGDIKQRMRDSKSRCIELDVETRMRREELQRIQSGLDSVNNAVKVQEENLESTIRNMTLQNERRLQEQVQTFQGESSATLQISIDRCRSEIKQISIDLEKGQSGLNELKSGHMRLVLNLQQSLSELRENKATLGSALSSLHTSKYMLEAQLTSLKSQQQVSMEQLNSCLRNYSDASGDNDTNDTVTLLALTDCGLFMEDHLLALADSVSSSRISKALSDYNSLVMKSATLEAELAILTQSLEAVCDPSHHSSDKCPVCDQPFLVESRKRREDDIKVKIEFMLKQIEFLNAEKVAAKVVYDEIALASSLLERVSVQQKVLTDVIGEIKECNNATTLRNSELFQVNNKIDTVTMELKSAEINFLKTESEFISRFATLRDASCTAQKKLEDLIMQYDRLKSLEAVVAASQSQENATVNTLRERIEDLKKDFDSRQKLATDLSEKVKAGEDEKERLLRQQIVLDHLAVVMGPRGIQHYVFTGVLRQLEGIANNYLEILADGGIQLSLESDESADRIVKSVLIRASDGNFRERALSQLSGGQWRRVSLALDFSFAEIIRRRGTLRSNLIVLDEILTHLDASGREAVGTLLRRMLSASSSVSNNAVMSDLNSAGPYETVLVILQDLAATELEEAFDHIDVVYKEKDVSRVVIDGGM